MATRRRQVVTSSGAQSRNRSPIRSDIKVTVLVANGHTCCICRHPGFHVQIHHIDGDRRNNAPSNLAVVCLNCHSRVTGDEGLGQRYSAPEVSEYKRRWEAELSSARDARVATVREIANWSERFAYLDPAPSNGKRGREYLYIHHELTRATSVALGLPSQRAPFEHDDLEVLIRELEKAALLTRNRPNTFAEYKEKPFVLERVKATKVFFPPGLLANAIPSLRELVVWVSEPSREVLHAPIDRTWRYDGTFLYLIGSFWQEQGPGTFYSGCSALQIIANVIQGKPYLNTDWSEPFARRSFLHPVEKLKQLNGLVMDVREYEVLYRSRYMSDEQCFVEETHVFRVHDLLAYPIFIATIL